MARRSKGISQDDRELWRRVTETAKALRSDPGKSADPVPVTPNIWKPKPVIQPFDLGSATRESPVRVSLSPDPLTQSSQQMDRRSFDRLRKGRLHPEARLDLHGMTADLAHSRLARFVTEAHEDGLRLVLVITGKGRTGPEDTAIMPLRKGVLRHSVPHWLAQADLRSRILQVVQAHDRHGGGGALYVYLRRRRGAE